MNVISIKKKKRNEFYLIWSVFFFLYIIFIILFIYLLNFNGQINPYSLRSVLKKKQKLFKLLFYINNLGLKLSLSRFLLI